MINTDVYFDNFKVNPKCLAQSKFIWEKGGHDITTILSYLYIPCKNCTKPYTVSVSNYIT